MAKHVLRLQHFQHFLHKYNVPWGEENRLEVLVQETQEFLHSVILVNVDNLFELFYEDRVIRIPDSWVSDRPHRFIWQEWVAQDLVKFNKHCDFALVFRRRSRQLRSHSWYFQVLRELFDLVR